MKLRLWVAILTLLPLGSFAQAPLSLDGNLRKYYDLVNQAELKICKGNLQNAKKDYGAAFAVNHTPFTKDIYNYMTLSFEVGDSAACNELRQRLLTRGYVFNANLQRQKEAGKALRLANSFNIFIDSLVVEDQAVRVNCTTYADICKEKIIRMDSILLLKFIAYIKRNGFPNDSICVGNSILAFPNYNLLLIHERVWGWNWIESILQEALNKGNMHPQQYASIIDRSSLNKPIANVYFGGMAIIMKIDGEYYSPKVDNPILTNYWRKLIGLESLEEALFKVKFQLKNSKYHFLYGDLFGGTLNVGKDFDKSKNFSKIDINE